MNIKTISLLGLVLAALTISGCSITGSSGSQPDGGVYKSTDGGKSFGQKAAINEQEDLTDSNILAIELDPSNPETIYIGTQNKGILRSTDGGESWVKDVNEFAPVTAIAIDPQSPQTIYIAAKKGTRGKILKTTNGAESWSESFTERENGPLVMALAIDKADPNILYAGDTLGGIYKSEDAGQTWRTLLWAKSAVREIAIDSQNSQVIYISTTRSGALLTRDGGSSFETIFDSGYIYDIEPHPMREGVLFLSNDTGLQLSEDFGQNWNVINTLVKPDDLKSRAIAADPQDENVIYYSSGRAFYKSVNKGMTWQPIQFNTSRGIEVITINPMNRDVLYLGLDKSSEARLPLPTVGR